MTVTDVGDDRRTAVRRMLEARSIALVGASARPGSFGERMVLEALRSPSAPRLHLVHPSYSEVQGLPCVPSLAEVPDPVDLVLLGVPDGVLASQLELARQRGDGGAVVFGSAVGVGPEIRQAAGAMPVVGPACMGFVNVARGVRAVGYVERDVLTPGPVGLVTHSGSAFSAVLRTHRRLEYSVAVSSGRELITTTADYLDYALSMPETRVVGLFMETLRDVPRLRRGLAQAAAQDVPVVALTVGASTSGGSLVAAHSGAVAGADGAWEALFRAYGVHRATDIDELIDTLEMLSLATRRRGAPRAVATVHDSGGERVLAADLAEAHRVPFADLSADTHARLADLLDDGLVPGNPLDVWGTGSDTRTLFGSCLTTLAADPSVGVTALAVDLVEEYDGDIQFNQAVLDARAAMPDSTFVVLAPMAAGVHQPYAWTLREAGIPVLEGMSPGLRALRHYFDACSPDRPPVPQDAADPVDVPPLEGAVDVAGALDLLAQAGLPVVATRTASTPADVIAAAADIGYPVALKTTAAAHKTEVGGVVLGLAGPDDVAAAYGRLRVLGDEVLVQAMAPPGVELTLGVVRDPHLGPLVVLGVGGVLVELVAERVVALPPVSEEAALALLDEMPKVGRLLDGYRGAAPVHRPAIARAVAVVSRLALAWDGLAALDVNPLLCTPDGVLALDALILTS